MLQQTRSETAAGYYLRWLERFPDLGTLAAASEEEVLKAWEGLGYYTRARNLHRAAGQVVERFGGRIPEEPEQLRSLPGVGEYTAAAVASIAFARAAGVVDGNVIRVVSRLLADDAVPSDTGLRRRIRAYVESTFQGYHPGWINQAWMELGALVCLPAAPRCLECPFRACCRAFQEGRTAELPIRRPAGPLPVRHGSLLVVVAAPLSPPVAEGLRDSAVLSWEPETIGRLITAAGARLLLVRRPPRGLLGGLWEFPNFPSLDPALPPEAAAAGIRPLAEPGVGVRHRYSHFETRLRVLIALANPGTLPDPLNGWDLQRWVEPGELSAYPRPQVHIKAMRRLGLLS